MAKEVVHQRGLAHLGGTQQNRQRCALQAKAHGLEPNLCTHFFSDTV